MKEDLVYTHTYDSPVGPLFLAVNRLGKVLRIGFTPLERSLYRTEENKYACGELEYQLDAYFRGELHEFSVQAELNGTEFQSSVWRRLLKIGYGETMSYSQVAQKIGRRNAARAVGNAVARNPVPILVPCHRVLHSSGGVGSYAARSLPATNGSAIKRRLLELEGAATIIRNACVSA